jgi:trans-aconitate methyltransferase
VSASGSPGGPACAWNPTLYASRAAFVHRMGADLMDVLGPRAGERILDVGCGTGELTSLIAASGAAVVGLDSSAAMLDEARTRAPGVTFVLGDAQALDYNGEFDAVFSNAAIHWMPRAAAMASGVKRALVPGGRFVAEFGGHGCIARVRDAVGQALERRGESPAAFMSWYFPTLAEYVAVLSSAGFDVTYAHLFDRPTPLDGDDGLMGWLQTFLPALETTLGADWEGFVRDVERAASPALRREGREGRWVLDYVRLRVVAHAPGSAPRSAPA